MTEQELAPVSVENSALLKFCDSNAGVITEFLRKFENGTFTDYELDGITPYVVMGEVIQCDQSTWIKDLCDSVSGEVDVINSPGAPVLNVTTWDYIFDFLFSPDLTATLIRTAGANNQFNVGSVPDGYWYGVTGAGDGNATYLITFDIPYTGILQLQSFTIDTGETYGLFKIDGVYAYPDVATLEPTTPNGLIYDQNGTFQWVVEGMTTFEVRFIAASGRGAWKFTLFENEKTAFQRTFESDILGNVTYEDYDLEGNPYVAKATIANCTAQYDEQILCDVIFSQASNAITPQTAASVTTTYVFSTDLSIVATISNTAYNTTLASSRDFYKTGAGNTTWTFTFNKALSGKIQLVIVNTGQTFGTIQNFSIPPDEVTNFAETSPGNGVYVIGTNSGTFTWYAENVNQIQWDEVAGPDAIHYRLYLFLEYFQEFIRHYLLDSEDNLTYFDTDPDGNFYAVLGVPESCNDELTQGQTIESYVWDLQATDVWSAENDVPAGYTLTGVTVTVVSNVSNDNTITGRNGQLILDVNEGTTMSWNCEDSNTLVGPSFYAGSDGRMFVHATVRRNKI